MLIAVVDDEEAVRSSLARLLRSAGYETAAFASGEEFLANLDSVLPDCLILDLRMPGLGGFEVLSCLARHSLSFPVVVLTSFPSAEARQRALRDGASAFLEKPAERSVLLDALDTAMNT